MRVAVLRISSALHRPQQQLRHQLAFGTLAATDEHFLQLEAIACDERLGIHVIQVVEFPDNRKDGGKGIGRRRRMHAEHSRDTLVA